MASPSPRPKALAFGCWIIHTRCCWARDSQPGCTGAGKNGLFLHSQGFEDSVKLPPPCLIAHSFSNGESNAETPAISKFPSCWEGRRKGLGGARTPGTSARFRMHPRHETLQWLSWRASTSPAAPIHTPYIPYIHTPSIPYIHTPYTHAAHVWGPGAISQRGAILSLSL